MSISKGLGPATWGRGCTGLLSHSDQGCSPGNFVIYRFDLGREKVNENELGDHEAGLARASCVHCLIPGLGLSLETHGAVTWGNEWSAGFYLQTCVLWLGDI